MTTTTLTSPITKVQPVFTLTQWTAATLVAGALLLVYLQVFLIQSFDPPIALMFGVPALIVAGLLAAVRRRWVPLLGVAYWLLSLVANGPYLAHDLAHPEFFPSFSFSVMLMLVALVGLGAGTGAAVQNYRGTGTGRTLVGAPRATGWFTGGLVALTSLGLGAILVAAIAPTGASAGVSAETLAALPALTTANHQFGQTELRAQTGETVALRLENRDANGHSFDIDEFDLHVSMPPGEPALALFAANAPGTYTFYCSVPGHREAGMVGTLIVEP